MCGFFVCFFLLGLSFSINILSFIHVSVVHFFVFLCLYFIYFIFIFYFFVRATQHVGS